MILQALEPTGKYQSAFGNEFMSTNVFGHDLSTRDISYLNRNLKDVVVLDYNIDNYDLQPENVILIHQFDGESNDDSLNQASFILKCKNSTPFSTILFRIHWERLMIEYFNL